MNEFRYSRQILFPPIGKDGQARLKKSSALILGVGALGTVISNHLVRAGIGKLRIVDRDYVEMSNLQRQMLFDESDAKKSLPKAIAAKNKLHSINSEVEIESIIEHASAKNIETLVNGMDIVLDGTDNMTTRFLLNDICFKHQIPFAYGGVVGSRGMNAFFIPGETPCLRCLVEDTAESGQTCDTVGVISPVVDIVSSNQVTDALKYLTGHQSQIKQSLTTFDIWYNHSFEVKFSGSAKQCPTCMEKAYPSLSLKETEQETVMCGRDTVQIHAREAYNLEKMEAQLSNVASVHKTPFLLRATLDKDTTFIIFPDGRVLVQGTEDKIAARTLFDRYIGS